MTREGDLISRQAVLDAMYELCNTGENLEENPWRDNPHIDAITDAINNLPPVNPQEPKTGHWITKDSKEQGYDIGGVRTWYIQIMCDKCGFIKTAIEGHTGQYKYCPNCGCRMIEPQESEG